METSSHKRVYGRAELLALLGWDPKGLAEPYRLTEAGVTFEPDPQTWRTLTEEERGALAPPGWDGSDGPVLAFPFSPDELLHFVESSAQPALMRWRELEEKDAADAFASLASNRTARELAMLLFDAPLRMAWYDETLEADFWFNHQDVGPVQAALLFCMQKPTTNISEAVELAKCVTTEFTIPEDFERLHQRFEYEAKSNPGQRTLSDWLRFALAIHPRGPRIHPWAAWYAEAAEQPSRPVLAGAEPRNETTASAEQDAATEPAPAADPYSRAAKRSRKDLLASLIERAVTQVGYEPSDVFNKLVEWAAQQDPPHPLFDVVKDSDETYVLWQTGDGDRRLTRNILKSRLQRLKKKSG